MEAVVLSLSLSLSLFLSLTSLSSLPSRSPSFSLSPFHSSSRLYKRQITVESAFSTDDDYSSYGYMCKRNIEEEEVAAEAKVHSMLPQHPPHPSLSGMPLPSTEHKVLIHIQRSKLDGNAREREIKPVTAVLYVCT